MLITMDGSFNSMTNPCPHCSTEDFTSPECSNCSYPILSDSQQTIMLAILLSKNSHITTTDDGKQVHYSGDERHISFLQSALAEHTSNEHTTSTEWVSNKTTAITEYTNSITPIDRLSFTELTMANMFKYNLFGIYGSLVEMNGSLRVAFNPEDFCIQPDDLVELLDEFSPLCLPLDGGESRIFIGETEKFFNGQLSLPHFCTTNKTDWIYGFKQIQQFEKKECDMCGNTVIPWLHYDNSLSCQYSQVTLKEVNAVASCIVTEGNISRTSIGCTVHISKQALTEEVKQILQNSPYPITETETQFKIGPDGRLTWALNWVVTEDPFSDTLNRIQDEKIFIAIPNEFIHNDMFARFTWDLLEDQISSTNGKYKVDDINHMNDKEQLGMVLNLSDTSINPPNSITGF